MNTHTLAANTHKQCVSICLLLVLASTLVAIAHAGSGTITIGGNGPAVTADSIKMNGTAPSSVGRDVGKWYFITAEISDLDLMNDIARVQVVLYKTAAGYIGDLDKERRYGVAWKTPVDDWEYLTDSGWGAVDAAYFDTTASSSWGGGNPARAHGPSSSSSTLSVTAPRRAVGRLT